VLGIRKEAEKKTRKRIALQHHGKPTITTPLQSQENDGITFPVSSSHNMIPKLKTSAL